MNAAAAIPTNTGKKRSIARSSDTHAAPIPREPRIAGRTQQADAAIADPAPANETVSGPGHFMRLA